MLLFITDYDPSTHCNWCVGRDLADDVIVPMIGDNATRDRLIEAISFQQEHAIFAMSHGDKHCLKGQNGTIAIGIDDAQLFAGRSSFAWACHTATELGLAVSEAGGIWWGYTGVLTAPEETEPFREIFTNIFRSILAIFNDTPRGSFASAIETIKQLCDSAIAQVDILIEQIDDVDIFSIYSCLNQIWERLRIWVPDAELPQRHRESKGAMLHL